MTEIGWCIKSSAKISQSHNSSATHLLPQQLDTLEASVVLLVELEKNRHEDFTIMSNIPSVHEGSKLGHSGSISHGIIGLQRILVLLVRGVKRVDNLIFSPLVSTKTVPELSTSRCPTDQHKLLYKNPLNSRNTSGLIFYSCFHLHRNQKSNNN